MQPATQPDTPGDAAAIAAALGRIPSGLFVIAWQDGGQDRCMLASWLMQAGFTPPRVAFAVASSRELLPALDDGLTVAISVLAESQRGLVARFAKPGADAFVGLDVLRTASGAAAIAAAAAWMECRPTARVGHGDHVVVLAEVLAGGGTGAEPVIHIRKSGMRY